MRKRKYKKKDHLREDSSKTKSKKDQTRSDQNWKIKPGSVWCNKKSRDGKDWRKPRVSKKI